MHLDELDYELPASSIAQRPLEPRDTARLLVDHARGAFEDAHVFDLPRLLEPGDVVVVNHTRVFPARLSLKRATGGAIEVLLLEHEAGTWKALVRGGAKLREGEELVDGSGHPVVRYVSRVGEVFNVVLLDEDWPLRHGEMPLPPYITERLPDAERYQTVYSRDARSAAAPTAGLHLTTDLMRRISERGVGIVEVELVVGLDTFKPIESNDPLEHRMHSEFYRVPPETIAACRAAKADGHHVIAIGTTATRALESAASFDTNVGRTSLYITPEYQWKVVDRMMTNFHMPRTTLIMMIRSFVGERWREIYRHAVDNGYRMLSFGDASLLDRHAD
jgi:S-adenosylmethionine:tRNA ribosyltransferase-isomerase